MASTEKKKDNSMGRSLPPLRSLSEIRREVREHTEKKLEECSDRNSFNYQSLMHSLSRYESEQLQARKASHVPPQALQRHRPLVRFARLLDRAEAEKVRQEEAIRRRNKAVTAQARRRILSTSLTRAVKAQRNVALNNWLHDTLTTNPSARRLRWLVLLQLSQISDALSQAMCSKRKRVQARTRFQAVVTFSSNALQAANRARLRIATNQVMDFLLFIQNNRIHFCWMRFRKRIRRSVILMQKLFREKLQCREAHMILLGLQLRRAVEPVLASRMRIALEDNDKRAQAELAAVSITDYAEDIIKQWLRRRTKEYRVSYLQWQRFVPLPQQAVPEAVPRLRADARTVQRNIGGERGETPPRGYVAPPTAPRLMGCLDVSKLAHKAISRALERRHRTATSIQARLG